jgi:hypothetical protein
MMLYGRTVVITTRLVKTINRLTRQETGHRFTLSQTSAVMVSWVFVQRTLHWNLGQCTKATRKLMFKSRQNLWKVTSMRKGRHRTDMWIFKQGLQKKNFLNDECLTVLITTTEWLKTSTELGIWKSMMIY